MNKQEKPRSDHQKKKQPLTLKPIKKTLYQHNPINGTETKVKRKDKITCWG